MDPYRSFDGEQVASFKSGKFSWGRNPDDNASERYILGIGKATSAMLPIPVLPLATILFNLSPSLLHNPRPARKIILGTFFA
jgi:hypothetical protein